MANRSSTRSSSAFYARVERDPVLRPLYPDDLAPGKARARTVPRAVLGWATRVQRREGTSATAHAASSLRDRTCRAGRLARGDARRRRRDGAARCGRKCLAGLLRDGSDGNDQHAVVSRDQHAVVSRAHPAREWRGEQAAAEGTTRAAPAGRRPGPGLDRSGAGEAARGPALADANGAARDPAASVRARRTGAPACRTTRRVRRAHARRGACGTRRAARSRRRGSGRSDHRRTRPRVPRSVYRARRLPQPAPLQGVPEVAVHVGERDHLPRHPRRSCPCRRRHRQL